MSQVNGKLSSRVMNMKFMKFSQPETPSNDDKPGYDKAKKSAVPDSSQWDLKSLPDASSTKKNKRKVMVQKKKVNVRSGVSITELKREIEPVVRGRRVVGESPEEAQAKRSREEGEDDDYDLDKIFKQVKTPH